MKAAAEVTTTMHKLLPILAFLAVDGWARIDSLLEQQLRPKLEFPFPPSPSLSLSGESYAGSYYLEISFLLLLLLKFKEPPLRRSSKGEV